VELNAALHHPLDLLPRPDSLPRPLQGALNGVHNLLQSVTATAALNSGKMHQKECCGLDARGGGGRKVTGALRSR